MRALVFVVLMSCGAAWAQAPAQKKQPKAPNLVGQNATMKKENRQLDAASKTMKKRREKPAENSTPNQR